MLMMRLAYTTNAVWDLITSVSFFNELDIEKELCSQTSVSFFNKLDIEKELCSKGHFMV